VQHLGPLTFFSNSASDLGPMTFCFDLMLVIDFAPKKSPKIADFENSTKKNLVNGQSAILRSGNPQDSHKFLSAIDVTAEAIC